MTASCFNSKHKTLSFLRVSRDHAWGQHSVVKLRLSTQPFGVDPVFRGLDPAFRTSCLNSSRAWAQHSDLMYDLDI